MEKINLKISKEKLLKIKDIVIFVLLFLWMIMPILQSFQVTNQILETTNIYFILMKVIAIVGIGSASLIIYDKMKKSANKKEIIKELLPILIFILFMIWSLFSCRQAALKKQAFNGNLYRKEGYFMYINYAGYFLCAFLLENKKLRKILLNTFIITSIFLMTVNRISLNIFTNNEIQDSVFHQFNHYGYYLMMSLICSLGLFITEKNKTLKMFYLLAYILIGYAMIYNNTFGCYLAICIFLILYAIYALIKKTDRKLIFIAIIIFTILSCVTVRKGKNLAYENLKQFAFDIKAVITKIMNLDVEDEEIDKNFEDAGTYRMELWVYGIKFISKKPIIGYGPDNLRQQYLIRGIEQDRPHNLLIYLAAATGIPGMIIYITAVGIIVIKGIIRLFKKDKKGVIYLSIVITYLISSMFGNSMYYTSPYFFIFLGSLMHYNLSKKEE